MNSNGGSRMNTEQPEQEKVREVHGFQCMFCGEIHNAKEEAELCWQRHVQFQFEPYFTLDDEFPIEVLVKKIEGNRYTTIATYSLLKKEKVDLPVKEEPRNESE